MGDGEITGLLRDAAAGDAAAFERVAAWAYADLERLAASRLRRRYRARAGSPTLEPAALVNETFLRLLEKPTGFANRRHFLAFAGQVMIGALIDYERRRRADKRGGDWVRITLSRVPDAAEDSAGKLEALREALDELERLDGRKADVVRLRVLWGAGVGEIARLLEISEPTVRRDWSFCRVWLAERLGVAL